LPINILDRTSIKGVLMFTTTRQMGRLCSLFLVALLCLMLSRDACAVSGQSSRSETPADLADLWDPARYISLDEIEAGMEGYCLTEYGIAGIEKFKVEVIDVVRDFEPGRDVVLVQGTDERFIHTGPVAGCSGSPVYIDGRLAGALAFAWTYSKDPLYGVTSIEDMLQVGRSKGTQVTPARVFDYSKPIDLAEVDRRISTPGVVGSDGTAGVGRLPCAVVTSGLPFEVCRQLGVELEPFGVVVVPGIGGSTGRLDEGRKDAGEDRGEEKKLVPGACLAVPLVSGDITIGVYGTVTEVRGQTVYGFGHPFLGYGPVDLPMATGKVHTVITSMVRSSKLAKVVETVGAVRSDEGGGILGQIGAEAQTFPVTVRIDRYNDRTREYNCRVASNRLLTPSLIRSIISGAGLYLGDLPPDHKIEYKGSVTIRGFEPIMFENVSTGSGLADLMAEASGTIALLMDNPYEQVTIESMEFDMHIVPRDVISHIWSANLSDPKVKAGDRIRVDAVIESVRADKKSYHFDLVVPEDLKPGKYELTLCGWRDYEQFLLKVAPYRFVGQDLPDLVAALRNALAIKRDRLYCYLVLPSGGITIEKAELPDLPATKALVLQSPKRPMRVQLYPHWLEKTVDTGTVVINKKTVRITVEE